VSIDSLSSHRVIELAFPTFFVSLTLLLSPLRHRQQRTPGPCVDNAWR
jgi:hypothetical protein